MNSELSALNSELASQTQLASRTQLDSPPQQETMPTPKLTSQAAVFLGSGAPLEMQEFDVPELADGEVLVRVECSTLCGSDIHTLLGRRQEPTPTILGHEAIGTVEKLGASPPTKLCGQVVELGDRVTWSVAVSCFECGNCKAGLPQKCNKLLKYGHSQATGRNPLTGGLAQYIVLEKGSSIGEIGNLPTKVACPLNCATATVAAVLSEHQDLQGKSVLILGAGMLGLTAAAFAKVRGAMSITVVDKLPERLELALQFGATQTIAVLSEPGKIVEGLHNMLGEELFDLVIELTGDSGMLQTGIEHAATGGSIVVAGAVFPCPPTFFDPQSLVRKCLRIRGIHNYTPQDLRQAIEFMNSHAEDFPFSGLVSEPWPLEKTNEAFREAASKDSLRIAVCP